MKIAVVFGTRPEIIKLAPIVEEAMGREGVEVVLINSSQHFDWDMSGAFLETFHFPRVHYTLADLPAGGVERFGQMLIAIGGILDQERPACVLVQGDTTTALVAALAGAKTKIPVVHVEAGLRSFNDQSPEELNRKVIGQIAAVHFAPTALNGYLLRQEGVAADRIEVVGNPVVDALRRAAPAVAALPSPLRDVDLGDRTPVLVTVHRPGNTDRPERLQAIVEAFLYLKQAYFFFPIHPRTRAALAALAHDGGSLLDAVERAGNILLLPPQSYNEFARLMTDVELVVTDSGGVQEEANTLGKTVVTLRPSTPRWEGILAGANRLCPTDRQAIVGAIESLLRHKGEHTWNDALYGDGHTARRIVDALLRREASHAFQTSEPTYYDALPSQIRRFGEGTT